MQALESLLEWRGVDVGGGLAADVAGCTQRGFVVVLVVCR